MLVFLSFYFPFVLLGVIPVFTLALFSRRGFSFSPAFSSRSFFVTFLFSPQLFFSLSRFFLAAALRIRRGFHSFSIPFCYSFSCRVFWGFFGFCAKRFSYLICFYFLYLCTLEILFAKCRFFTLRRLDIPFFVLYNFLII